MNEIELYIPEGIVESLPPDGEDTKQDMGKAIQGWERELNAAITVDDDEQAVSTVVDHIQHFEARWEQYDEYVVELRYDEDMLRLFLDSEADVTHTERVRRHSGAEP